MKGSMFNFKLSHLKWVNIIIITFLSGCDYSLQQQLLKLRQQPSHIDSIVVNRTFNHQNKFLLTSQKVNQSLILLDTDLYCQYVLELINIHKSSVILYSTDVDDSKYNQVKFNIITESVREMSSIVKLKGTLLSIDLLYNHNHYKTISARDIL